MRVNGANAALRVVRVNGANAALGVVRVNGADGLMVDDDGFLRCVGNCDTLPTYGTGCCLDTFDDFCNNKFSIIKHFSSKC